MRYIVLLWSAVCLMSQCSPLVAADSKLSPSVDAMKKFDLWVGEWKGSGWSISEEGRRIELELTESVQRKAGGRVFLVEGKGVRKGENGKEVVVHDGVSMVHFDEKTKRYFWNGHESHRDPIHAEISLIEGGFQWTFAAEGRGATIRFTIKLDDRHWREFGDVSVDGKNWNRFMEVVLERRK